MLRIKVLCGLGASAACATALALAPTAGARVPHDPCPGKGIYSMDGSFKITGDSPHVYSHYSEFRICGDVEEIAPEAAPAVSVHCPIDGYKLAGTSANSWYAHRAHWDFWAHNGEWVTSAFPHIEATHYPHRGTPRDAHWATRITTHLKNWNLSYPWRVRMFATCDRIPGFY